MKPSRTNRPRPIRRSMRWSMLAVSLPIALVAAGCGSDDPSSAAPSEIEVAAAASPSPTEGDEGAAFCDAVAQFDAVGSPGGPEEPTIEDMQAFAATIGPMVDSMVADAPVDAVDAVAALDRAVERAADGDLSVNGDATIETALATIEQSVRDNCDVAIVDIVGTDHHFEVPDTIPAGPVSFRLINEGEAFHVFLLLEAPPDVTDDVEFLTRFMDAVYLVESGGDPAVFDEFAPYDVEGNHPAADAGGTGTSLRVMEPGEYIYFCPIPLDFAKPQSGAHFQAGMHGRFTVEG